MQTQTTISVSTADHGEDGYSLSGLIHEYYVHRKIAMPNAIQAYLFLTSEVGELADAIVSMPDENGVNPPWTRNTPGKERSVADEIGDIQQMLTVTAMKLGLDPIKCMVDKWEKKGWNPGLTTP